MATLFRAAVMLIVLVGLPAAWVYYGPLPPEAMSAIQRTVATAKESMGWPEHQSGESWREEATRTAPRFDSSLAEARRVRQQQAAVERSAPRLQPVKRDPQFALTSSVRSTARPAVDLAAPLQVDGELARQLEPHLALLRSLDAAEYTLENWGGGGQFYRFRCAVALGASEDHTRLFEAIDTDPVRAVHQVVGEVTSWQNARRAGGPTRWQ